MKKFLSAVLAAAMLISVIVVLAAVPAAAVEGEWIVYGTAAEHYSDFDPAEDDETPVAGYSYVNGQGLVVTPADWKDFTPEIGLSTRNKVNLKDGVYLLIRVDDFTFTGDKWFTYSISDVQYLDVGSTDLSKFGERLSMLTRPDDNGKLATAEWRSGNFEQDFFNGSFVCDETKYYDDGKILLELVVEWDGSSYSVKFNGTDASAETIAWMNEKYGSNSDAYINLNVHNSTVGGTAAITVLKYGTDAETATVPQGDDYAEKRDRYKTIAPIANPDTVEANKPAILMNGSREMSDSKATIRPTVITSLTPENYIHYTSDRQNLEIGFAPKYEVSYDIDDFPVIIVLTKNFCTCGEEDGSCIALESADMYIMTGEYVNADGTHMVTNIDMCYDTIVRGEDSYLYFYVDTSDQGLLGWDAEGRFNGARFDIKGIRTDIPGANEFDICFMALFRNLEEAEAYVNEFVGPEPEQPTDTETDEQTPVDTDEQTPVDTEDNVDTPDDGETTKAPEKTEAESEKEEAEGGCASSVGFGMLAIIALAGGCGFVAFKKRK